MPPKKRTLGTNSRRSKRLRPSELPEVAPTTPSVASSATPQANNDSGLMQVNVEALATTISVAVTEAVNAALANRRSSTNDELTPVPSTSIVHPNDQAVDDEVTALTGVSGTLESCTLSGTEDGPRQLFTSIAISLGSRVSAKIKAKIWQNEYVDFGALLGVGPPTDKFALSLSPGNTISSQNRLHLEPVQSSKKVQTITQWITAFNTFVAIYVERVPQDASKLMKYCEVVRDIAFKSGEWLFYDEQFRFLRQSAPEQHPWDQIHWELWLRAMVNSRGKIPTNQTHDNRPRSRSRTFPKGTCWTFHAGKTCSGCNYEHICYKCGAKHPASHCSASGNHTRHGPPKSGISGVLNSAQHTGHARKGGSA